MDQSVALPTDSLPRVARMGINRRPEQMPFRRHVVDVFALNFLTGADARCTIDGREFMLGADMVHFARKGDVMSGLGTADGRAGVWRWVGFTWPGAQAACELPRLTRLVGRDRAAYEEVFDALFEEYKSGLDGWDLRTSSLLIRLIDILRGAAARAARVGPGAERARLAAAYIERHALRRMRLREVGDAVDLSVAYLTRIFRAHYGTTPMQHLMRARLREARRLLIEEPRLPVKEVAARAGFADVGHFARAFRRGYRVSPTELRLNVMAVAPRR
jgi:AraC-like DNA-binding protein